MFIEYKNCSFSGDIEGELLPIICVCGFGIKPWEFPITIYKKEPTLCPKCGRKYYFKAKITIFVEGGDIK